MSEPYRTSPIKRHRRTAEDIDRLKVSLIDIVAAQQPMTCRQCFYQMVARGHIEKTEREYKNTVCRLLLELRRDGLIPYVSIADNTRWMRKPRTYEGLAHFVRSTAASYRRSLWSEADTYVEVWCEKDALAGVLMDVTEPYDVPLMISRGFASETFLWSAGEAIRHRRKPAFIYVLTDHDPSGDKMLCQIERGLHRHAGAAVEVFVERLAVTTKQIERWNLPTRPTKRDGNMHAHGFKGDSVELDAIPPDRLRGLVEANIKIHVDQRQIEIIEAAEESERGLLTRWAQMLERREQHSIGR